MEYSYVVAFSIGLLSVLHCVGMCSGIIGALSFSLPAQIHNSKRQLLPYVFAYNVGRIMSYTVAGGLVAGLSGQVLESASPRFGHSVLLWMSTIVLLIIGLHLSGWFPKLHVLERMGQPVWRRLEPYGRRLLPVKSPFHAFMFGAVWGWLPCGLVYSTLIWAASSGEVVTGALLMFLFGLGTLPTTVTAGMLTGLIKKLTRMPQLRRGAGMMLIVTALISPIYALNPGNHEHHNIIDDNAGGKSHEHQHLQ